MMPVRNQQMLLFSGAMIALAAAFWILTSAGLPQRSDFTGFVDANLGRVAPEVGAVAPPFKQVRLSGGELSLSDLRGKSVIVNFWATWCIPCRVEMPELQTLHSTGTAHIIGINIGEREQDVVAWVDALGLTFDILLDEKQHVYADYQVRGQPATYVITPDGIITHIFFGPTTANALQRALSTHSEGNHLHG